MTYTTELLNHITAANECQEALNLMHGGEL